MADDFADFDQFDDMDNLDVDSLGDAPEEGRGATTSVIKSGLSGFTEEFTDDKAATIGNISKKIGLNITGKSGSEIEKGLDVGAQQLKKTADELRVASRPFLKSIENKVPKGGILEKIHSKLLGLSDDLDRQKDQGDSDEARIQAEINQQLGEKTAIEDRDAKIKETYNRTVSQSALDAANKTASFGRLAYDFHNDVTSSYYRKSLELKYKILSVTDRSFELAKASNETMMKQLEGIVRNTALPDIVKTKNSEMLKHNLKASVGNNIKKGMFGDSNLGERLGTNISNKIKTYGATAVDLMGSATDQAEQSADLEEMGVKTDHMAMAGGMAGDSAKGAIANLITNKIRKSKLGGKYAEKLNSILDDPENALAEAGRDKNNKFSGFAKFLKPLLKDTSSNTKSVLRKDTQNEAAIFDMRTKNSINLVIPAYLAKIESGIRSLRTKKEEGELTYDRDKFKLVDSKSVTGKLQDTFKRDNVKNSVGNNVNALLKTILSKTDKKLNPSQVNALKDRLYDFAISGKSLSALNLVKNGFYEGLTKDVAEAFKDGLDNYLRPKDSEDPSKPGTLDVDNKDMFNNTFKNIKKGISNPAGIVQDAIDDGSIKELEKQKIVKFDSKLNKYVINEKEYHNIQKGINRNQTDIDLSQKESYGVNKSNVDPELKKEMGNFVDKTTKRAKEGFEYLNKKRIEKVGSNTEIRAFLDKHINYTENEEELKKAKDGLFSYVKDMSEKDGEAFIKALESDLKKISKQTTDKMEKTKYGKLALEKARTAGKTATKAQRDLKALKLRKMRLLAKEFGKVKDPVVRKELIDRLKHLSLKDIEDALAKAGEATKEQVKTGFEHGVEKVKSTAKDIGDVKVSDIKLAGNTVVNKAKTFGANAIDSVSDVYDDGKEFIKSKKSYKPNFVMLDDNGKVIDNKPPKSKSFFKGSKAEEFVNKVTDGSLKDKLKGKLFGHTGTLDLSPNQSFESKKLTGFSTNKDNKPPKSKSFFKGSKAEEFVNKVTDGSLKDKLKGKLFGHTGTLDLSPNQSFESKKLTGFSTNKDNKPPKSVEEQVKDLFEGTKLATVVGTAFEATKSKFEDREKVKDDKDSSFDIKDSKEAKAKEAKEEKREELTDKKDKTLLEVLESIKESLTPKKKDRKNTRKNSSWNIFKRNKKGEDDNDEDSKEQKKITVKNAKKSGILGLLAGLAGTAIMGSFKGAFKILTGLPHLIASTGKVLGYVYDAGILLKKGVLKVVDIVSMLGRGLFGLGSMVKKIVTGDFKGIASMFKNGAKKVAEKVGIKTGTKVGAKLAEKEALKAGEKVAGKTLLKTGFKSLIKKVPLLGLLATAGFVASDLMAGDFKGAGVEAASGLVSQIPIVGWGAGTAIDVYKDDIKNAMSDNKKDTDKLIAKNDMKSKEQNGKELDKLTAITSKAFKEKVKSYKDDKASLKETTSKQQKITKELAVLTREKQVMLNKGEDTHGINMSIKSKQTELDNNGKEIVAKTKALNKSHKATMAVEEKKTVAKKKVYDNFLAEVDDFLKSGLDKLDKSEWVKATSDMLGKVKTEQTEQFKDYNYFQGEKSKAIKQVKSLKDKAIELSKEQKNLKSSGKPTRDVEDRIKANNAEIKYATERLSQVNYNLKDIDSSSKKLTSARTKLSKNLSDMKSGKFKHTVSSQQGIVKLAGKDNLTSQNIKEKKTMTIVEKAKKETKDKIKETNAAIHTKLTIKKKEAKLLDKLIKERDKNKASGKDTTNLDKVIKVKKDNLNNLSKSIGNDIDTKHKASAKLESIQAKQVKIDAKSAKMSSKNVDKFIKSGTTGLSKDKAIKSTERVLSALTDKGKNLVKTGEDLADEKAKLSEQLKTAQADIGDLVSQKKVMMLKGEDTGLINKKIIAKAKEIRIINSKISSNDNAIKDNKTNYKMLSSDKAKLVGSLNDIKHGIKKNESENDVSKDEGKLDGVKVKKDGKGSIIGMAVKSLAKAMGLTSENAKATSGHRDGLTGPISDKFKPSAYTGVGDDGLGPIMPDSYTKPIIWDSKTSIRYQSLAMASKKFYIDFSRHMYKLGIKLMIPAYGGNRGVEDQAFLYSIGRGVGDKRQKRTWTKDKSRHMGGTAIDIISLKGFKDPKENMFIAKEMRKFAGQGGYNATFLKLSKAPNSIQFDRATPIKPFSVEVYIKSLNRKKLEKKTDKTLAKETKNSLVDKHIAKVDKTKNNTIAGKIDSLVVDPTKKKSLATTVEGVIGKDGEKGKKDDIPKDETNNIALPTDNHVSHNGKKVKPNKVGTTDIVIKSDKEQLKVMEESNQHLKAMIAQNEATMDILLNILKKDHTLPKDVLDKLEEKKHITKGKETTNPSDSRIGFERHSF